MDELGSFHWWRLISLVFVLYYVYSYVLLFSWLIVVVAVLGWYSPANSSLDYNWEAKLDLAMPYPTRTMGGVC